MSNKAGVKKVKGAETAGLVPRLRFPEFRGAGEWKEERIGDVLDYTRPEAYIVSSTKYENEGIPVLTANKSFVLGYTTEDWGIFQDVPVIIFDDFTVDRKYVDFPFKVKSSAIKILKARGKNRIRFIFESMNQIRFDAAEHKRHYISTYRELIVRMPEAREQQRIADCLSSLDEVITLEAKRLEALKVHKKGLMQQLFPAKGGWKTNDNRLCAKFIFLCHASSSVSHELKRVNAAAHASGRGHAPCFIGSHDLLGGISPRHVVRWAVVATLILPPPRLPNSRLRGTPYRSPHGSSTAAL